MPINNVQAIQFSNEQVRPGSDTAAQMYYSMLQLVNDYDANDIISIIPNEAGNMLVDGSVSDGRSRIDGAEVTAFIENVCRPFVTDMDANGGLLLDLVLKISVNPNQGT